jgi:UDP-3-O-[3-hydroxymyristoyl] glucosamine N-acyltransferase
MTMTASDVAALVRGRLHGPGTAAVSGVATAATATPESVVFVDDAKRLDEALRSAAGVILAGPFAEGQSSAARAVISCENPRLAFARVARALMPAAAPVGGVHPSAVVHPSAIVGNGSSIGPHAVIDEGVVLGEGVSIGPGTHVGRGVRIGAGCVLRANVVIYPGSELGARVLVHAGTVLGSDGFGYVRDEETGAYEPFPQVGRLVVEDDVEFGSLCTVDRGALGLTRIGAGTKLDNQVHVAHNVTIGRNVVIAAQTGIAGSSVIEDNVVVAGQVGIADHVRIESGAILGAQCGVPTGKVIRGPGVLFWGTPARPIRQYLKELAALARLVKK